MTSIHDLAPSYVRDDLDEDETAAFRDHLASCGRCREDVALLGGRKHETRPRRLQFEKSSWLRLAAMVFAAGLVAYGFTLFLG